MAASQLYPPRRSPSHIGGNTCYSPQHCRPITRALQIGQDFLCQESRLQVSRAYWSLSDVLRARPTKLRFDACRLEAVTTAPTAPAA
jgi:hypothetical protein